MDSPAIRAVGIWKEYVIAQARRHPDTLYETLTSALKAPVRRFRNLNGNSEEEERFWALRDVNLEVQPGEVVGVIGRNGAGKSTLLKILSRITAPTSGRIEVRGRMASLLEVGTGFHPELNGRENIYLNATILGMAKKEVDRKFDEIVAFSGVEKFLEMPVKRYSSGMYVRLAFAVAAHVQADILLVDEVLAVGDADFQKRCFGKMEEVAGAGRTVLFVSHNLTAIRNLCTRGLMLEKGELVLAGSIEEALEKYSGHGEATSNVRHLSAHPGHAKTAYVSRVAVRSSNTSRSSRLGGTEELQIEVDVQVSEPAPIDVFLHCYNDQQTMVFSSGSFFDKREKSDYLAVGVHRYVCEVPGHLLNDGSYTLDVLLVRNRSEVLLNEPSVLRFRLDDDYPPIEDWQWRPAGVIRPKLKWRRLSATTSSAAEVGDAE